ncbi:alpha/beta fold hydrolase [Phenylobacterium sp.]|uniref:alpha/beta fold hydrolase n=1 Tax=Phenylobacterium sp. TaxID=1871053 RepID=UPI00271D0521|nr:alpha/beta hydrolase [Phenylobacterium sp.]MDO8799345.1 alpha/beta hydrolase [Phenylobacterium sp.]
MAAPIVMVHGAFCGGWAFEAFRAPFEAAGHMVITPDLRGHAEDDRPGAVAGLSMTDYAKDIAALCAGLPEPPILIGHSLGGLVAQLAAKRAPLKALILLAPSPPWGVSGSSMEEAVTAFGLMMGAAFTQSISPDRGLMRAYSLDRMPQAQREAAVAQLRPESGRALWEALNWWLDPFMTTSVGTGDIGVPCLVIVGQRDVVHPPMTARQTAQRLGADYLEMAGMSHWLLGETGWQAVATAAWDWLEEGDARATSGAA